VASDTRQPGALESGTRTLSTRDRLIRTTGRLLRRQGYAATGLNQVMAEADAPKGSMYFHFPGGKEELAAAAVDKFAEAITKSLRQGVSDSSSVDAITQFFDDYIAYIERTEFRDGCAVATVALDEAATHPLLRDSADRALRTWVDLLADVFVAEGRVRDDAHRLATLVIATIEGAIVMSKARHSTEPLASSRDALLPLLESPSS
jgi:TetR/AcrR family transcriptional regulator, lmrAB and yxaGH operons repressor